MDHRRFLPGRCAGTGVTLHFSPAGPCAGQGRGDTSPGSGHGTLTSPRRPDRCWTCRRAIGQGNPSAQGPHSQCRREDQHPSLPPLPSAPAPAPGRPAHIEDEYERGDALQYLAAWDARRGCGMGRCESTTGIEPFGRLITQVLLWEPYRSAARLFSIVDNGSSHRGATAKKHRRQVDARIILRHTPVHASWLNQVEIDVSIVQRKVMTPMTL
jgi:hypothetical protein